MHLSDQCIPNPSLLQDNWQAINAAASATATTVTSSSGTRRWVSLLSPAGRGLAGARHMQPVLWLAYLGGSTSEDGVLKDSLSHPSLAGRGEYPRSRVRAVQPEPRFEERDRLAILLVRELLAPASSNCRRT